METWLAVAEAADARAHYDALERAASRLALSTALAGAVRAAWERLAPGAEPVVVRSSAFGEDARGYSFAGQYTSVIGVASWPEVARAVVRVCASQYSRAACLYRERFGVEGPGRMAVLVQRMVHSTVAGVAFSVDPLDPSRRRMRVEAVRGHPERLVAGRGVDASWIIPRQPELRRAYLAERQEPTLDGDRLSVVCELCLRLERELGYPVDVEWAFEDRAAYLLQARPITVAA
jgi:pyruvate,water dikinase